jgi:hypothetical protein
MRKIIAAAALLTLAACAHTGARREVNAIVQDEHARQAAAATAEQGQGSKAALQAGAEVASPATTQAPR